MIAVSIVSHGHGEMVAALIRQLILCPEVSQIIVTRNLPETVAYPEHSTICVIENAEPEGFAANHNAAFERVRPPYFCVVNPDIELVGNPFPGLLKSLAGSDAALVAPLVLGGDGQPEDYARRFPNLRQLVAKAFL